MRIILITSLLLSTFLAACGSNQPETANSNAEGKGGSATAMTQDIDADSSISSESEDDTEQELAKSGVETIYTDLVENKCKDVDINEDEGWSVQSCKGVGGYELLVSEGDLRQTVDVLAPNKKKFELNYWTVVSGAFSTVGDKAEWRVKKENGKVTPIALIVRYNVSENPENADEVTSYLTVSKISDSGACVTDVVKPIKNANQIARDLADVAGGKPCKKGGN